MSGWLIASVSWGKDSTAMLHLLIESGHAPDEVVFYDTGAEFDAIYAERDKMLPILAEHGVKYTELHPREPFFYSMLARPVRSRATGKVHKHGYGWCGGPCRWGTTEKTRALDRYAKSRGAIVCVGIAADETRRIERERAEWKRLPLVEAGMTEADCLELCYERGHTWEECGVRLYDVLDRVSCWCCRNKNLKELEAMREHLPDYYERLVALEHAIGEPMKRRALAERGE
ncbi:MAG TPA: phosphoadenosine phosphosulfate reductase family protein [Candidatus Olsenella pullicola]|nr:phosphoadenosine phosphosulfate reductase family protein [Candidatus Olsenella pullicola]